MLLTFSTHKQQKTNWSDCLQNSGFRQKQNNFVQSTIV